MLAGKSLKLSRSQCLRLGREEIPKIRRLPDGRVPQINWTGGVEGQPVISTGGPSVCLLRNGTSGTAVVELTSSRVDSLPRRVGNRNSLSNDDGADVVDPRTKGISVGDLETACSRVCLELTEVLMHIQTIGESVLQSESNRLCSHKARRRVDNDLHWRQVLVLAWTFRRKTSTNSPRSSIIKPTLDISSEYMMPPVNSCCTRLVCSELWMERISGRSWDVRGVELQVVCVCGAPASDLDPRMSLRGLHAAKR